MKSVKMFLILLVSLFTLTGCSTVINVDIENGEIKENIEVFMSSLYQADNVYDYIEQELFDVEYDSEILGYFKINNNVNSNPLKAYKIYKIDEYQSDLLLNRCFDKTNINLNNNILVVKAEGFNCYSKYNNMDKITINLKSNYNVISSNADSNLNGVYTWNIDRRNTSNNIEILLDLNEEKEDFIKNNNIYFVFVPFIVLLILGLIILFKKKIKNNSQI